MVEQFANGLPPDTWAAQLHAAAKAGEISTAERLITSVLNDASKSKTSLSYSVDAPDIDLYTPLHRAVEEGHTTMVRLLLKFGANINVSHPGLDGWTVLHLACWAKKYEIIEILLREKADTEALDWYASRAEDLGDERVKKIVTEFLKNKRTEDDWSSQGLTTKCENSTDKNGASLNQPISDIQARMIEFSLKHCDANGIGGEWSG